MEISGVSARNAFKRLMKQGFVFRLKGEVPFESEVYHVFMVLNYNPSTGEALLLVNGTSQVEKRFDYLSRVGIDVDATTVILEPGTYSFITKRTIFDCNSVSVVNVDNLPFDGGVRFIGEELSDEDIKKIIEAVMASDSVPRDYKDLIKH